MRDVYLHSLPCPQLHSSVRQTLSVSRTGQVPGTALPISPAAYSGWGAVPRVPPTSQHLWGCSSSPGGSSSPPPLRLPGELCPAHPRAPQSLPSRRAQGSEQHPPTGPTASRVYGSSKSARRGPTSALSIGSGAPRPAHWRCRRRPALHKAPLGGAAFVGSRQRQSRQRRGRRGGMRSRRRGGAGQPPWPVSTGRGVPVREVFWGCVQLWRSHRPAEKLVADGATPQPAPRRARDAGGRGVEGREWKDAELREAGLWRVKR